MKNQITITKLDSILCAENTLYKYEGININVYRVKNDVNGNPMYRLTIFDSELNNITHEYKGVDGRYYSKKGFISLQSYNLSNSIEYILNNSEYTIIKDLESGVIGEIKSLKRQGKTDKQIQNKLFVTMDEIKVCCKNLW